MPQSQIPGPNELVQLVDNQDYELARKFFELGKNPSAGQYENQHLRDFVFDLKNKIMAMMQVQELVGTDLVKVEANGAGKGAVSVAATIISEIPIPGMGALAEAAKNAAHTALDKKDANKRHRVLNVITCALPSQLDKEAVYGMAALMIAAAFIRQIVEARQSQDIETMTKSFVDNIANMLTKVGWREFEFRTTDPDLKHQQAMLAIATQLYLYACNPNVLRKKSICKAGLSVVTDSFCEHYKSAKSNIPVLGFRFATKSEIRQDFYTSLTPNEYLHALQQYRQQRRHTQATFSVYNQNRDEEVLRQLKDEWVGLSKMMTLQDMQLAEIMQQTKIQLSPELDQKKNSLNAVYEFVKVDLSKKSASALALQNDLLRQYVTFQKVLMMYYYDNLNIKQKTNIDAQEQFKHLKADCEIYHLNLECHFLNKGEASDEEKLAIYYESLGPHQQNKALILHAQIVAVKQKQLEYFIHHYLLCKGKLDGYSPWVSKSWFQNLIHGFMQKLFPYKKKQAESLNSEAGRKDFIKTFNTEPKLDQAFRFWEKAYRDQVLHVSPRNLSFG